jgi:hypothetical protein
MVLPQQPPVARRVLRTAMMLEWVGGVDYRSRLFT